jgi:dethiobiotin synthetase
MKKPPLGLFVTGTDTEVGKTWVASMIVRCLVESGQRVGVYKPVASDCIGDGAKLVSDDALALWEAAGRPLSLDAVCPQKFSAPLAAPLAARAEGRTIDSNLLREGIAVWADECDIVVVEGAGGLMSPVSEEEFVADIAADLGYPLVVVAPNVLGVINQSLQTLITAACFRDGLPVAGVILNDTQILDGDVSIDSNQDEIARRTETPILGRVRYESETLDCSNDWMEIARSFAQADATVSEHVS